MIIFFLIFDEGISLTFCFLYFYNKGNYSCETMCSTWLKYYPGSCKGRRMSTKLLDRKKNEIKNQENYLPPSNQRQDYTSNFYWWICCCNPRRSCRHYSFWSALSTQATQRRGTVSSRRLHARPFHQYVAQHLTRRLYCLVKLYVLDKG